METRKHLTLTDDSLSIIAMKLGYQKLQDWQVKLTGSILDGKDIVFTAGTGCGKTTLLYAPLIAFRLQEPMAVGLSITPTKALGRDQVQFHLSFCLVTETASGTFCPIEGNSCCCH